MGDADLIVAVVALVISVIVGFVITSQLLTQIILTAEGQRKCSSSLLGLWSKDSTTETRKKWRWSEARFEIKFVVPEIILDPSASPIQDESDDALRRARGQIWSRFGYTFGAKMSSKRKTVSVLGADTGLDFVLFICSLADDAPDLVSWLNFLAFLRLETGKAKTQTLPDEPSEKSTASTSSPGKAPEPRIDSVELSWPCIKYRLHSWDFMPPNAPKPFAQISVHDIALLARRTGMTWKTFDPKNGNMSAEGGAHILTGTVIQGMGLVLEYRCLDEKLLARGVSTEINAIRRKSETNFTPSQWNSLDKARARAFGQASSHNGDEESQRSDNSTDDPQDERQRKDQRVSLWVKAMDKFIFGVIPANSRLGLPDFRFANEKDCFRILKTLSNGPINKKIRNPRWPFNDLIYVAPPVLRIRRGEKPTLCFKSKAEYSSIFSFDSSLVAFGVLLRAYLNGGTKIYDSEVSQVKDWYPELTEEELDCKLLGALGLLRGRPDGGTEQMKKILRRVEKLATNYGDEVMAGTEAPHLIEELHDDHDSTTQYFGEKQDEIHLYDLLQAHFSQTIPASLEAQATDENLKFTRFDWDPPLSILEMYFSYIPEYVKFMREKHDDTLEAKNCEDGDLVIEAWFTMMWRGFLFRFLHKFELDGKGIYVPYEYYGSRLPISLV